MCVKHVTAFCCALVLAGCQSSPALVKLNAENSALKSQLASAQQQISSLEAEQRLLAADVSELKRVNSILDTEKNNRKSESAELRLQVRKFTQSQIDSLKEFLVQSNLLDYVGEVLIDRNYIDSEAATLVDASNPMPHRGALIGVNGYFAQATRFYVSVLRPVGNRYVVIWQSELVEIGGEGYQRHRFAAAVGVEEGDVMAYEFPNAVGVKYDKGTGGALMSNKPLVLGASVEAGDLKYAAEKRAYSIGVFCLLD